MSSSSQQQAVNRRANLLNLDYRKQAHSLGPPPVQIVDVHTHVNGALAAQVYRDVARLYGVGQVYSMTHLEDVPAVQDIFGDSIRFIAVPKWTSPDRQGAFTTDWLKRIEQFARVGCRICKFWSAPRSRDYAKQLNDPEIFRLDGKWTRQAVHVARDCGMMFMTHVGDPDTWFNAKYTDTSFYGTHVEQYISLEKMLDQTAPTPWIAAHFGGWPENLEFLDGLLTRHDQLHLDTSATKWIAREISKHEPADVLAFLDKWRGRILFGSDIVTTDDHLHPHHEAVGVGHLAQNADEAFELYASRYWVLRTLWESDYNGPSPIADPDLAMVEPGQYDEFSSPNLRGMSLPEDILRSLYHDSAMNLLNAWHTTGAASVNA